MYTVSHYINGKHVTNSDRTLDIYNPVLGQVAGHVTVANQKIIADAITAATNSQPDWAATSPSARARILFRYKTLLDQNINEIAKLITQEHGKTLADAVGSVQRGIDVVEFACGIPFLLKGSFAENIAQGMDCYSLHQPLGLCVGITPFNFPGMIPLWMFPLAIMCGNTFILKPSEKDPSCSIKLVELAQEAGVPPGVVNVVQGDKETVDALITHPAVNAVSFVGSTLVAEHVYKTASAHHKRVQAFGGAKNHCVVMPDADLDQAANALVPSAYGSAGERCMALSVVVAIGDAIADALIQKMTPLIKAITIGPGTETKIDMGPLVTQAHWERVQSYLKAGQQEGAKLLIDGSQYKPDQYRDGYFMGCSLFDHVTSAMRIYKEEIFGPVLCIMRVKNLDEAIALINNHEYGNGAAIFTNSGHAARMFAEKVQAGMVGVNVPIPVPVAYQSFGGWKRSIFADIGMYGEEAVKFYTKLKTVTQRWVARKST